jgi:DNA-directed RNA polymerase subunit RPC12/RpoP
MSEYKYACPVCGQHMRCDSSQAGTVMECPTCFQKITAPQAPAAGDSQKFVLTGTKVGERPLPKAATETPAAAPVAKSFPWVILIVVLIAGLAGAAVFALRGKFSRPSTATTVTATTAPAGETNAAAATPKPPAIITSDTNWTLNLETVATPEAAAVGRIHGQSSMLNRAIFQAGVLTLRPSVKGSPDVMLVINFGGALPEALAGNTINVTTNAEQAAGVSLRWKENGQNAKQNYDSGYALRLEMGPLANNHMPGKIYFCAPDDLKSYVMGTFNVEIRKPKPPKPKK